jgi:hypothetical protein
MSSMNTTVETNTSNFWQLRKSANEALEKAKLTFNAHVPENVTETKPQKQETWTKVEYKKSNHRLEQSKRAIDTAQDNIIKELKSQIMLKKNYIETGLAHQVNFSHTTIVNTTGVVTVEFAGHPYDFSKERFFENRHFQDRVRNAFSTVLPGGWLVFFKGREEGTYCIKIVCKR